MIRVLINNCNIYDNDNGINKESRIQNQSKYQLYLTGRYWGGLKICTI